MTEDLFKDIQQYLSGEKEIHGQDGILTDTEVQTLILNALNGAGSEGLTEEVLEKIKSWAEMTRLNAEILSLVLSGLVHVGWSEEYEEITVCSLDEIEWKP